MPSPHTKDIIEKLKKPSRIQFKVSFFFLSVVFDA
jgi:hypothetical protein